MYYGLQKFFFGSIKLSLAVLQLCCRVCCRDLLHSTNYFRLSFFSISSPANHRSCLQENSFYHVNTATLSWQKNILPIHVDFVELQPGWFPSCLKNISLWDSSFATFFFCNFFWSVRFSVIIFIQLPTTNPLSLFFVFIVSVYNIGVTKSSHSHNSHLLSPSSWSW